MTFTLAATLIVLLPGPDTLVVIRGILLRGRRNAVQTAAGVLTGLTIWATAAVIGLSALLRASHAGYTALRIAGAVYLVTLGTRALLNRGNAGIPAPEFSKEAADAMQAGDKAASSKPAGRGGLLGTGYLAGLASDLLNPKVGVFFVTFLPGFVPHDESVGRTTALFGAIFVIETGIYFAILLILVDRTTRLMRSPTARRHLDRATGLVLVTFGIRLATEG